MRRFVNPGKRIASFTRTFARMRWALNFDGVGVRGQLANRTINPDGDIDIEWFQRSNSSGNIVSQCDSTTTGQREFLLRWNTGKLDFQIGGSAIVDITQNINIARGLWRVSYSGTTVNVYLNGALVHSSPNKTRGIGREPSAPTRIGVRNNGSTFVEFFQGLLFNVKINGTLWPMADRNQSIQLPEPSGLGAELITQSVLENPATKGTQWTYLGDGRWQYVGDGSLNVLEPIALGSQPASGFLQFEVESITGTMVSSAGSVGASSFNSAGVFRYFYTVDNANNKMQFKRSAPGTISSCIIKNISFKPLGTCNPMTLTGANAANWVEVSQ